MADVNDGDIIRVGAGLVYDGLYDVVNVWHILATMVTGISWATLTTLLQDYLDDIYDNIKTPLNDEIGTGAISVANVTQVTTLGAIPWSPGWAGVESGEPTAAGVCCFTWARTYKPRVQIRKYFGVFGEVNVSTGSWTTAVQNACKAAMDYHIAEQEMNENVDFQGVAYNRLLDTYEVAYSSDVSAEPAYQRRRKRGRGS